MTPPTASGLSNVEGALSVAPEILEPIKQGSRILVAGHIRPDGDCLGSGLGLLHVLETMGKTVRFMTPGPIPANFSYLPGYDRIETVPPEAWAYDLVIYVDSAEANRVLENWYPQGVPVVNIDHHISNPRYADYNWVDSSAAAAAEMITWLAEALKVELSADAAMCLFTGIMTDTGGFRFSNTSSRTLITAGQLAARGANPGKIAEAVFDSRPPAYVRLSSVVMGSIHYELGGRWAWASIDRRRMAEIGAGDLEPEGFSNELRAIEGVEVGILFSETLDGSLRIGFRGRGKVDLSKLAQKLGGGGHRNASGAHVNKPFAEALAYALAVCREELGKELS